MNRNHKKYFTKIIVFITILIALILAQHVYASMSSSNYSVWIDNLSAGGGRVESTTYIVDSSLSGQASQPGQSTNFYEKSGFSAIDDEPTVGFNVSSSTLNFGELSTSSTAYSSNTFSAYTNSNAGYTIKVYGEALHTSEYTLTEIGATAQSSSTGTEQFGMNLVANATPVVGQDPSGGIGQAATNYDTANNFAYNEGDVIAQAASFTYQTDYTASIIINIEDETPSGNYGTTLTYEFITVY